MPCIKCSNGKWKIGNGKCMYTSLEKCKKAEAAYYASRKENNDGNPNDNKDRKNNE